MRAFQAMQRRASAVLVTRLPVTRPWSSHPPCSSRAPARHPPRLVTRACSVACAAPPSGSWKKLYEADGILVPGGFGSRGIEGMIAAANYARTARKPYLGICLGMQVRGR
jgi:hypothetical protein